MGQEWCSRGGAWPHQVKDAGKEIDGEEGVVLNLISVDPEECLKLQAVNVLIANGQWLIFAFTLFLKCDWNDKLSDQNFSVCNPEAEQPSTVVEFLLYFKLNFFFNTFKNDFSAVLLLEARLIGTRGSSFTELAPVLAFPGEKAPLGHPETF